MAKTSRVGGATSGSSPTPANDAQVVTVGMLAALLKQLGFSLSLTGTAGYGAPSESSAASSSTLTGVFVQPDVAVTGKLLTTGGLGVGNSASGTTAGNIAKKIQVFDAAGASLGYLPVYDAIT